MTKPITSVAFMMLVEEGRVALEEPVHRYIPAWRDLGVYLAGTPGLPDPPADAPMPIVDLLRHTSGLTYGFQSRTNVDAAYRQYKIDPFEQGRGPWKASSKASRSCRWSSRPARPGTTRCRPNVVGYLVGMISGKPFEQFLKERIFAPLGMVDTAFFVPKDKAHRLAECYLADPQGGFNPLAPSARAS